MTQKKTVLRDFKSSFGTRYLDATITLDGDLVIEGHDIGEGVERWFGAGLREYEWTWTIRCADAAALLKALGTDADLLTMLKNRFSGDNAAKLQPFLDEHHVRYEAWSRIGD